MLSWFYPFSSNTSEQQQQQQPSSPKSKPHDPKIARRWMTYLAKHEKTKHIFPYASLLHLPFVGSHDAGTYAIETTSELAADLPEVLKKLPQFLNVTARRHIATWSKCQNFNLLEQLETFGVRYFDLRICPHADEVELDEKGLVKKVLKESLWLTHGSFSIPVDKALEQIVSFLEGKRVAGDSNSTKSNDNDDNDDENLEVFILDLQKVTGFTSIDHYKMLIAHIRTTLGKYLVPREYSIETPLKVLWANGWRIFLLVQEEAISNIDAVLNSEEPAITIINSRGDPPVDDDYEENIVSASPSSQHPAGISFGSANGEIPHPPPLSSTATEKSLKEDEKKTKARCFSECLHARNPLSIRSLWFNKRYKQDLVPRLKRELNQRSKTFIGERAQLHVLQAVLTPQAGDMLWSFGTGQSGAAASAAEIEELKNATESEKDEFLYRHSIWDFAKNINSDIITLWEDETAWKALFDKDIDGDKQKDKQDSFFVYKTVEDLRKKRSWTDFTAAAMADEKARREREQHNLMMMANTPNDNISSSSASIPTSSSSASTALINGVPFDLSLPSSADLLGFDPRNILMIDFVEVGRSKKTGKNSFQVCFDLACRRFGLENM